MGGSVGEWMSGRLDEWDGVLSRCMYHGWIWVLGDMDMGWGHGGAWEGERGTCLCVDVGAQTHVYILRGICMQHRKRISVLLPMQDD